ncbi:MAG: DUF58 domain-containing protein [Spongiibacteraceae bacterium]
MRSVTLTQRRIFIFPSQPGCWFFVVLLVMLIAAINYQNNMTFALVFLLLSVFIVTILHTFANLSGLTLSALRTFPVFAGENAEFELLVARSGNKDYFDINIGWPASDHYAVTLTDCSSQVFSLFLPATQRGYFKPNRLLVETRYPLGLLRAWTWLALDIEVLVFPKPLPCVLAGEAFIDQGEEGGVINVTSSDDFYALTPYRAGDPLKHIDWKSYAKGQELQVKQFASFQEQRIWLELQLFTGSLEQRLSKLCYWVLELEKNNVEYGLRLGDEKITPAKGQQHQLRVLTALAVYQPHGSLS